MSKHAEGIGLATSEVRPLGDNTGVLLSLRGKGSSYRVQVTPTGVTLKAGTDDGVMRQLFQNRVFNHVVAGQLFRLIQAEETNAKR